MHMQVHHFPNRTTTIYPEGYDRRNLIVYVVTIGENRTYISRHGSRPHNKNYHDALQKLMRENMADLRYNKDRVIEHRFVHAPSRSIVVKHYGV